MKQKLVYLFSLLALLFGFIPLLASASTSPDVIISEIAWAGSSSSAADEWIELANVSDQDVDVSGWSLAGASSAPLVFPAGTLIPSHSTFLIANYANTNSSSILNENTQIITTLVSIPNDKLAIALTAPDRGVVDSAGNAGTNFAGKSGGTGSTLDGRFRSMERRDFLLDGTTKDAWIDADVSSGFKTGTLDYGTPGSLNSYLQTEIEIQRGQGTTPILESGSVQEAVVAAATATTEPEPVCEDVTVDTTVASTTDITQTPIATEPVVTESVSTISDSVSTVADTQTETQTVSTSNGYPQGTLRVSEIFPHPATGESEWVELENTSAYPVTTNGWSILDASGAATLLPDGSVNPGLYIVIENPKGKLNNDGDSVIIKDANGSVVDSVLYNADLGSVPDVDESLVRTSANALAITTTVTKNTSNISTPRATATSTSSTANTSATSNATTVEPIATNTETVSSSIPTVSTTSASQSSLASPALLKTLRLSEFYPNTNGNDLTDEFIEIENTGDQTISLDGWSMTDAGGAKFLFAKDAMIAAHTFKTFLHPETKISLNNTGDTISLTAPDGSVVDTQTYDQAKASLTYARTENVWNWTGARTPNEPNVVSGNSDPVPTTAPVESTGTASANPTTQSIGAAFASLLTIEGAKLKTDGTRVKVHGVVTVLPNTFNSQTMYIQDDTGGIQIFKSDCLFPTLVEGQSITVTGVLSHINGEARIKVTNQKSLIVSSVVETVAPSTDSTSVGSLITIAGMITSRSGNRLAINVDGETMNVDLPKATTAVYKTGSNIQVSGVLAKTKSGVVLKARSEQDVTAVPRDTSEQIVPNVTNVGSSEPKQMLAIVLIVLASLAFLGLKLRPHLYALIHSYGRKQSLSARPQKTT